MIFFHIYTSTNATKLQYTTRIYNNVNRSNTLAPSQVVTENLDKMPVIL